MKAEGIAKSLLVVTVLLSLSTSVIAKTGPLIDAKAFSKNPSPLPAGARIVAGDLSKNEFFILGGTEAVPVIKKSVDVAPVARLASNKPVTKAKPVVTDMRAKINVALSQVVHARAQQTLAAVAVKKPQHQMVSKKVISKISPHHVVASQKVKTHKVIATKKVISKVKLASVSRHPVMSKPITAKLKVAVKKTHLIASKKVHSVKIANNKKLVRHLASR